MFSSLNASQVTRLAIFTVICFTLGWLAFTFQGSNSEFPEAKQMIRKAGGLGAEKTTDPEVEEAVKNVKEILEEKTNTKYDDLEIISYKPQLVAGMNYFVKVKAKPSGGVERIMHLRIYRDLKKNYELTQFQLDKTLGEELTYFQ